MGRFTDIDKEYEDTFIRACPSRHSIYLGRHDRYLFCVPSQQMCHVSSLVQIQMNTQQTN